MNNLTNKCCSIDSTVGGLATNANLWDMEGVGGKCEANHFHGIRGKCVEGRTRCLINGARSTIHAWRTNASHEIQPYCKMITFGGGSN